MIIVDPIYGARFLVIKGGKLNDAIARFSKSIKVTPWTKDYEPGAHFAAYTTHNGGLIWFSKHATASLVSHEAFHATYFILTRAGLKLTDESEEAYSYYLEFLVREITAKIRF